jgi:glycosyltransferase involved in cell wall biosynthesis
MILMKSPLISVVLPAYNSSRFLPQAVNSILNQTFTDFELLIINDGSIDDIDSIVMSFNDNRIIYIKNDQNCGLVYSLNKGIQNARGIYVARMDADDIALPERFKIQKEYLDQHPEIGLVASTIQMIDINNNPAGYWPLDLTTLTPSQIRKKMAEESCLAHPSIMGRRELFLRYQYKEYQKNIEDYDLWLRLLNEGIAISKIKEPLLLYRIHDTSITKSDQKKRNVFFKVATCKYKFITHELANRNITFFLIRVFLFYILDILKGMGKEAKKIISGKKQASGV